MEPNLEVSDKVDAIARLPLPALYNIIPPYDPTIQNTPPRPPNTFVLFRIWMSKLGDRETVIAHLIWREVKIRDATRGTIVSHFERLANEAKMVHARAYPDYKYRPGRRALENLSETNGQRKRTYKKRASIAIPDGPVASASRDHNGSEMVHYYPRGGFELRVQPEPLTRRAQGFEPRLQPESLTRREQAYPPYPPMASTSNSVNTSRGRTSEPRYLPEPVVPAERYLPSASSSHSYSYPHPSPHSHSSHSSHHADMSSSSSSSPSPRHSPSASSSSSDSDFEFNFKYQRERQPHDYRHPTDVPNAHNRGAEGNVARNVNSTARTIQASNQRQSFEYSDYDSDPEGLDQDA